MQFRSYKTITLLNQAHAVDGCMRLVSWNCFGSHISMCVCVCLSVCLSVCLPPGALITSGVIWCDIGRVLLSKPVSRLFPAFNYFIWQLPLIKWMGVAILMQHIVNTCQRKLRWHGTSYKRTTVKTGRFIYNLQLHSNNLA